MLHAARPRGSKRGHRRASRTGKQRERFETETPAGSAPVGRPSRHAAPARPGQTARRCLCADRRTAYNRPLCRMNRRAAPSGFHARRAPPDRLPDACLTHTTGWIPTTARCSACIRIAGSNARTIPTARPGRASGSAEAPTATWRAYAPTCPLLLQTNSRTWPAANRRWRTMQPAHLDRYLALLALFRTGISASSARCRTHSVSTPTRASR